jgi:hypothetical protein
MARRVDGFQKDEIEVPRRYPWPEWTDESVWEIRHGEDYDVATENMRVNLHERAKQQAMTVRTEIVRDGDSEGLRFQFLSMIIEGPTEHPSDRDGRLFRYRRGAIEESVFVSISGTVMACDPATLPSRVRAAALTLGRSAVEERLRLGRNPKRITVDSSGIREELADGASPAVSRALPVVAGDPPRGPDGRTLDEHLEGR